MTEPDFPGVVGTTVAESTPHWATPPARGGRPNVVMVVLDDTGWSDVGCYGSEIATPAIDALAAEGLRYTNFHVTPLCSPTRAALLTGRNHHAVGMRFLADADTGFPNSRGRVHPDVPMLPQVLRAEGYGTYLVGKWHLTPLTEITPAGPYHNWPLARGFDRFYGFLSGCTDQYTPELYEDNRQLEPPGGEGYHLSTDLADRAIGYLTDHTTFRPEQPFFLQLAFGATHAPFQAPKELVDKYVDVFAKGWDRARSDRLHRQRELGVVPEGTQLCERNPDVHPWDDLTAEQRLLYTHLQAAYAGFLEHADAELDRVLAALEELGQRDDTVVLVCSDNGASREGGPDGAVTTNAPYSGVRPSATDQLPQLDLVGGPDGPAIYPTGWAMAGNTPFRRYKQFTDLGGMRSPLVVSWRGRTPGAEVRTQFTHAIDVMPTLLDLLGVPQPDTVDGASFAGTFNDADAPASRDTQYWETLGHRAIWHRGWKAVAEHTKDVSYDADRWRLYDTAADFSESHDLATTHADVVDRLVALWWEEAKRHQVLPLDDRTLVELIGGASVGLAGRHELVLRPRTGHLPVCSKVTGTNRSMRITARMDDRAATDEGVVIASGSSQGGYTLYVLDGYLTFEHHCLYQRVRCIAGEPAPVGSCTVGLDFQRDDTGAAHATLLHDERPVGSTVIPTTISHPSFWGLDVGRDPVSQVTNAYAGEFTFPATVLRTVTLTFPDS